MLNRVEEDSKPGLNAATAPNDKSKHALLSIVMWFCKRHSTSVTKEALINRLPDNIEMLGWSSFERAFEVVGLKSAKRTVSLDAISPAVLPCLIRTKNDELLILNRFSENGKACEIISFDNGEISEVLTLAELSKKVSGEVLLVTSDVDALAALRDASSRRKDTSSPHWFWRSVRECWSSLLQVLVAALCINLLGLALPIFVMNVYDRVIPSLAFITLWTLAAGVVIAMLLDLLLKMTRTYVLERTGRRIDLVLASKIFRHAMNIRLLDRNGGAGTTASQIRDFEMVREFFTSSSFVALVDLLFIGLFVAVLWMIVGPIAVVPLLAVPLVIIIALLAQIPIGASIERMQQLSGKKLLVLTETLLGIETVKSVNGEPVMQREWENAIAASSRISTKTRFWSNFAIHSTMFIQQSVSVIIILWGVYLVSDGQITIGGLIAANILAGRVLAPLGNISQTLVRAQQAVRSLNATDLYMSLPSEKDGDSISGLQVRSGDIQFKNVSLTYPESQVPALSNLSLAIKPGEAVGVVGRVGSGKTTVGKLLSGLIQPSEGIILIDGHEVGQYDSSSLRHAVGYLPQDPDMFTGTILENITIGKPDATDEEINRALYYSGMDYFIAENPEGLKQFVGEKGNRLSGGQRQAISIARLILKEPKVLFLDEPTNSMDQSTEGLVTKRLSELTAQGVTLIISTHRHSIATILDRLVVLEKGRIVMSGDKDTILKKISTGEKGKS
ncbi:MAG: type I secretion system permease/ATPase [Pseudomonadota bacterium]